MSNYAAQAETKELTAVQMSIYALARTEANRHKWIESEKAGRDIGEQAVDDWFRRHWRKWCRERWLEHLKGERCWDEFGRGYFGLLRRKIHPNVQLVERIVSLLRRGEENLSVLRWAVEQGESVEEAIQILRSLDVNSGRLTM